MPLPKGEKMSEDDVTIDSGDVDFLHKNDFGLVVSSREDIKVELDALKQKLKAHNDEIESMMIASGVADQKVSVKDPLSGSTHYVKLIKSTRTNLSKQKLVEFGVEPMVIAQATSTTNYSYVKVTDK